MRKTLLLQTALVAIATLSVADIAAAQTKAQPLGVSVGGYLAEVFKLRDDDNDATTAGQRSVALSQDAEIYFNIRGVLDNGTVLGGRVELEAATDSDQIDERYLFIERGDIGRVELGSTDRASSKMVYGAPVAIPGYGTIDPTGSIAVNTAPAGARTSGNQIKFAGIDDAEGINLYTSANRYFGSKAGKGLQLGVSYTPDGCQDLTGCGGTFGSEANSGQFSEVYTFAANYLESFGPVDLALYGAYERFDIEANSTGSLTTGSATVGRGEYDGYVFGTTLTYNVGGGASVQLGGAYKVEEMGVGGGDERNVYSAGIRYLTNGTAPGSVGIGVDFAHTQADQGNIAGISVAGEDEYTWYSAGVTYQVAKGVLTFAGIGRYEYDDAVAAGSLVGGTVQANNDSEANFGVMGIRLDF